MNLIIQHEDMSNPLLELEGQKVIPNVGDTLDIYLTEKCKQTSLYKVTSRHFSYEDNGELSVLVWVKGNLPEQDEEEWRMRDEQLQEWLDSIEKRKNHTLHTKMFKCKKHSTPSLCPKGITDIEKHVKHAYSWNFEHIEIRDGIIRKDMPYGEEWGEQFYTIVVHEKDGKYWVVGYCNFRD